MTATHAPPDSDAPLLMADQLQRYWGARDDYSFDPDDGLAGARLPRVVRSSRVGRLTVVNLNRRSPVNLRRLFAIPPTKSASTVGYFASACLLVAELFGSEEALDSARRRMAWLRSARVGGGWAHAFDVETRNLHYPRSVPNVVCTAFAANAFLDAAEGLAGDDAEVALDVAVGAARFARDELLVPGSDGPFFGYHPNEDALIHHGNVLAARLLVRAGSLSDDDTLIDAGLEALPVSLRAVDTDGSLPYGVGSGRAWIDGHHTGLFIESLADIDRLVPESRLESLIGAMAAYYRDRLFGADGRARSRPGSSYPLDALAAAQGAQTFAKLGGEHLDFAGRIAEFTLDYMARSGTFLYQSHRFHVKPIPYARWADAPMCLALAEVAAARARAASRCVRT